MNKVSVRWSKDAVRLLGKRDRYTQETIRTEFENAPTQGGVEFDAANHLWVTPVADNRYSVVWEMDDHAMVAKVQAVVPARFTSTDPAAVREQVGKVVSIETNGAFELP